MKNFSTLLKILTFLFAMIYLSKAFIINQEDTPEDIEPRYDSEMICKDNSSFNIDDIVNKTNSMPLKDFKDDLYTEIKQNLVPDINKTFNYEYDRPTILSIIRSMPEAELDKFMCSTVFNTFLDDKNFKEFEKCEKCINNKDYGEIFKKYLIAERILRENVLDPDITKQCSFVKNIMNKNLAGCFCKNQIESNDNQRDKMISCCVQESENGFMRNFFEGHDDFDFNMDYYDICKKRINRSKRRSGAFDKKLTYPPKNEDGMISRQKNNDSMNKNEGYNNKSNSNGTMNIREQLKLPKNRKRKTKTKKLNTDEFDNNRELPDKKTVEDKNYHFLKAGSNEVIKEEKMMVTEANEIISLSNESSLLLSKEVSGEENADFYLGKSVN